MNITHAEGFGPVWDTNSRVLILGSFPSVKSRAQGFYYGNPQNRFWRTVCGFFGEDVPKDIAGKRAFLLRRNLALWDVVTSCDIMGSSDATIHNETVADIPSLLGGSAIGAIFCNGKTAFRLFAERFPALLPMTKLLPSTSPANPRWTERAWTDALRAALCADE